MAEVEIQVNRLRSSPRLNTIRNGCSPDPRPIILRLGYVYIFILRILLPIGVNWLLDSANRHRSAFANVVNNPENVSNSLEALVFAVYASIFSSMEEGECQKLVHDQKAILMKRYRQAAHQALINSGFIRSSSLMTLQAYMFFLVSCMGPT
jgi:hypothetical protein